jgi:hypothetical protein
MHPKCIYFSKHFASYFSPESPHNWINLQNLTLFLAKVFFPSIFAGLFTGDENHVTFLWKRRGMSTRWGRGATRGPKGGPTRGQIPWPRGVTPFGPRWPTPARSSTYPSIYTRNWRVSKGRAVRETERRRHHDLRFRSQIDPGFHPRRWNSRGFVTIIITTIISIDHELHHPLHVWVVAVGMWGVRGFGWDWSCNCYPVCGI